MLDRPIAISAFGAPSGPLVSSDNDQHKYPNSGQWRQPWTEQGQADWMSAYGAVALSKPYVESICWHELADPNGATEMRTGGLLDRRFEQRESYQRMIELRHAIQSGKLPNRLMDDEFLSPNSTMSSSLSK
jgi:hypothetical protein